VCRCEALFLRSAGHRVDTANGGGVAWRALRRDRYDLLVTDYLMPGVSGLALVRQLRVANIDIPVVLVTGSLQTLDTAKLARDPWTRIHAFVPKPFTRLQFLSAVESALAQTWNPTPSPRTALKSATQPSFHHEYSTAIQ
jgi:CheY-like chemotaxis protein